MRSSVIAVISSNEGMPGVLQAALAGEDYHIIREELSALAASESARDLLLGHRPVALVCTLPFPYRESWELLDRLRTAGGGEPLPTLLLAGAKKTLAPLLEDASAVRVLPMPFELDEFRGAIRELLRLPPGQAP